MNRRPVDVEERARLLAEAYTFRQHIENLEDEILTATGGTIPTRLVGWVQNSAHLAVVAFVSGQPIRPCPFDTGDTHPLRRALGRYWWECYETVIGQYRASEPTKLPAPRLLDGYQTDDWEPARH